MQNEQVKKLANKWKLIWQMGDEIENKRKISPKTSCSGTRSGRVDFVTNHIETLVLISQILVSHSVKLSRK